MCTYSVLNRSHSECQFLVRASIYWLLFVVQCDLNIYAEAKTLWRTLESFQYKLHWNGAAKILSCKCQLRLRLRKHSLIYPRMHHNGDRGFEFRPSSKQNQYYISMSESRLFVRCSFLPTYYIFGNWHSISNFLTANYFRQTIFTTLLCAVEIHGDTVKLSDLLINVLIRFARWYVSIPKIPISVNFRGPWNGKS
jgi:hypothetical protein